MEVHERLLRTVASAKSQVRAVLRARIVLAAADGLANGAIARELEISMNTVRKRRGRFAACGPAGLRDAERSGRPRTNGPAVRMTVVATATSKPPHPEATWSHRAIAQRVASTCFASVSASQLGRILADLDLKPHKVRGRLTRRDIPDFWQRAADVCALYLEPPEGAAVLSIDEKTAPPARAGIPGAPRARENPSGRSSSTGVTAATRWNSSCLSGTAVFHALVLITPGEMALTRVGASSTARADASALTLPLVAAIATPPGDGRHAPRPEKNSTDPSSAIIGAKCLASRMGPRTLVSKAASSARRSTETTGPLARSAATLTRWSSLPAALT